MKVNLNRNKLMIMLTKKTKMMMVLMNKILILISLRNFELQ